MKLITKSSAHFDEAGGKGKNLLLLQAQGIRVPELVVIPYTSLNNLIIDKTDYREIIQFIKEFNFSDSELNEIRNHFQRSIFFSVRSSAIDEDGSTNSFAGQFESVLYIKSEQLNDAIKKVWLSAYSERIIEYRKHNNLPFTNGISIVIQEMIDSDVAGVGFGIDPVSGNRKHRIISSVYGTGEGLVSGELDADVFTFDGEKFSSVIANKTYCLKQNPQGGTLKTPVTQDLQKLPSLNEKELTEVRSAIDQCSTFFNRPQDIEFAFKNNIFYLLQSRPVTTLSSVPDRSGDRIVWDNSNIIESYPGVTTPLTFSFIIRSYENAYRLFLEYLGATQKEINSNAEVFANTLGLINGRVYYNLRSWYQMLAMVPGYSLNAGFMEKMMGVKEKFELPNHQRLSKTSAWLRTIKMLFNMFIRYKSLPRKRKAFKVLIDKTIDEYKQIDYSKKNITELKQLYIDFENKLLNEWKAPLLNDFFAMVWFGMLQKRCEKYGLTKNNVNIHNDLLCGSNDIISVQPIHRTIEIATFISSNQALKEWFLGLTDLEVWKELKSGRNNDLKSLFDNYIRDFGERCIGELKLETVSYTQAPDVFIGVVRSYVVNNITTKSTQGNIEEQLRLNAQKEVNALLGYNWYKKYKLNKTIRKAREMVSNRENLRYERTRAFGIVRELFSQMGNKWFAESILEHPRDIFYLTREEILNYIGGTSVQQNLKPIISARKTEFEKFKTLPVPAERIETYGLVYHANDFFSLNKIEKLTGDLKGIGCCPGKVKAKVRVITDPRSVHSLEGDILVTSSTDPGWVTLFPSASAIIVERGSLLSHSAIVAREMGIPCIVGVTGLLRTLQTGDEVEMDGSTGFISIINKNQ